MIEIGAKRAMDDEHVLWSLNTGIIPPPDPRQFRCVRQDELIPIVVRFRR